MPFDGTAQITPSLYAVTDGGGTIVQVPMLEPGQHAQRAFTFGVEAAETSFRTSARNIIVRALDGKATSTAELQDALALSNALQEARAWKREAPAHQSAADRLSA